MDMTEERGGGMVGWIARDEDGELVLFDAKPYRDSTIWNADSSAKTMIIDKTFYDFPIEWEDEARMVEITLKVVTE